jgi:hypothetical protein
VKNVNQNQKLVNPRGKEERKMKWPAVSSPSYEIKVGLDPDLHNLLVAKNNMNEADKKLSAKMRSKEYYHESKLKWNISKQKKCFTRHPWWKEMSNGDSTSEAWKHAHHKYPWWKEEMVKEIMSPKTNVLVN